MFCLSCYVLELVYFAKFLHYSNSFANFIIYALKIPKFRRTVFQILCGKREGTKRPKERPIKLPAENKNLSVKDIEIELNSEANDEARPDQ